jgi:hypothetical protein
MSRSRASVLAQPHRAAAANPATAGCAMWLSPEQLAARHEVHTAAGRTLAEEVPCVCGNHNRRVYL